MKVSVEAFTASMEASVEAMETVEDAMEKMEFMKASKKETPTGELPRKLSRKIPWK